MIAASEEFLREIAPHVAWDGSVSDYSIHMSAVIVSHRLLFGASWFDEEVSVVVFSETSAMFGMASRIATAAVDERRYDRNFGIGDNVLIDGMPFVGWSISSESRRIHTPPQPGEGDFIKYLGRDL